MKRKQLIKDVERMDEIADRLVNRDDIWQDRFIYWMAIAIRDILLELLKGNNNV